MYLKSKFALRLLISTLLLCWGNLAASADVMAPSTRAKLVERINQMADRHAQGGKMDTATILNVYGPYRDLMPLQEMAEMYETAYLSSQKKHAPGTWETFKPTAGWIVAAILFIATLFKSKLEKWLGDVLERLCAFGRRRFTAWGVVRKANLRRYCKALRERHAKLKIPFSQRELVLKDIFVPLRVVGAGTSEDMDANEAMRRYARVVVTGNPGAGKSMLLNHLTLCFAEENSVDLGSDTVPVLLPLHRVHEVNETRPIKKYILDELVRCNMPAPSDFLETSLKAGSLILLFDGLDEVKREHRREIAQGIKDLLNQHANCRAVITCRTAVYENDFHGYVDEHLMLTDFADHQILAFLQPWMPFMPEGRSTTHLLESLRDRPRIMAMARNPLQLTMICSLYADGHQQFTLPHSRSEFYQLATQLFLERWHQDLGHNVYSRPQKAAVLEHLGHQFHMLGDSDINDSDKRSAPLEWVLSEITKILPQLNLTSTNAQTILDEIVERSGLLLRIDGGERLQFAHLTIQEYFAAKLLTDLSADLLTYYQSDPPHWREVMRLWCGLDHDCSHLVREVFATDPVMSLECVADAQRIDDDVAATVVLHFKEKLADQITSPHVNILEAYAAVASNPRPRGSEMLSFLAESLVNTPSTALHTSNRVRRSVADALATTNLSAAAGILFKARQRYPDLASSLVGMGDLAVMAIRTCLEGDDVEVKITAITDLAAISTPQAGTALVRCLWDESKVVQEASAWALATLLTRHEIEQVLSNESLEAHMKVQPRHTWAWAPFNKQTTPVLTTIINRIVEHLTPSKKAPPFPLSRPLEPRIAAAILFAARGHEAKKLFTFSDNWAKPKIKALLEFTGGSEKELPSSNIVNWIASHQRKVSGPDEISPADLNILWEILTMKQDSDDAVVCLARSLPISWLKPLVESFRKNSSDLRDEWKTLNQPPSLWWKWRTSSIASLVLLAPFFAGLVSLLPFWWARSQGWTMEHIQLAMGVIFMTIGYCSWISQVIVKDRWKPDSTFGHYLVLPAYSPMCLVVSVIENPSCVLEHARALALSVPLVTVIFLALAQVFEFHEVVWTLVYIASMILVEAVCLWQRHLEWKTSNPFRVLVSLFFDNAHVSK